MPCCSVPDPEILQATPEVAPEVAPEAAPEAVPLRSVGGPLLSALTRLPRDLMPSFEVLATVMVAQPDSFDVFRVFVHCLESRQPIAACRKAMELVEALFGPQAQYLSRTDEAKIPIR